MFINKDLSSKLMVEYQEIDESLTIRQGYALKEYINKFQNEIRAILHKYNASIQIKSSKEINFIIEGVYASMLHLNNTNDKPNIINNHLELNVNLRTKLNPEQMKKLKETLDIILDCGD